MVGQVDQGNAVVVTQRLRDAGPVLPLTEQAVQEGNALARSAELGAVQLRGSRLRPAGHCRRRQHALCQWRRSSSPVGELRVGMSGQTTTCGVPNAMTWSHPGQRYGLTAAAPATLRTIHRPSRLVAAVLCP